MALTVLQHNKVVCVRERKRERESEGKSKREKRVRERVCEREKVCVPQTG